VVIAVVGEIGGDCSCWWHWQCLQVQVGDWVSAIVVLGKWHI